MTTIIISINTIVTAVATVPQNVMISGGSLAFTPFRFFLVDIMKAMKAMKAMLVLKGLGYYRNVFPPSLFRWARLIKPTAC